MSRLGAILLFASIGAMVAGAVTLGIAILLWSFGCHFVAILREDQP